MGQFLNLWDNTTVFNYNYKIHDKFLLLILVLKVFKIN